MFQVDFGTEYTDGSKFTERVNIMSSPSHKWFIPSEVALLKKHFLVP